MDKRFDKAFNWILLAEGGEVDDPDDAGGHTKYGISKRSYPFIDIHSLTKETAKTIYYRDYWLPAHCDELPAPLNTAVFDCAVNSGARRAILLLQVALKTVRADGVIGRRTLAAIAMHDPKSLTSSYLSERAIFYTNLAQKKPTQRKFLRGWLNRLFNLIQFIK